MSGVVVEFYSEGGQQASEATLKVPTPHPPYREGPKFTLGKSIREIRHFSPIGFFQSYFLS